MNKEFSFTATALFCAHLATLPAIGGTSLKANISPSIDLHGFSSKYLDEKISATSSYNSVRNSNYIAELKENKKRIKALKLLSSNWNMAGAIAFENDFIDNVESLLIETEIQPKIFPTGRNSIQFEYEKENGDYLEFEIFKDKIQYLKIVNEEEKVGEFIFDGKKINEIVLDFYA